VGILQAVLNPHPFGVGNLNFNAWFMKNQILFEQENY
jgi:hypothetical protein